MLKNIVKSLIVMVIIFVLTLTGDIMVALATTKSELENDLNKTQEEINKTNEELDEVESQLLTTMKQIESLSSEIESYENEISDLNSQIEDVNAKIETAEIEIKQAEEDYIEQQKRLEQRLVALYKTGNTTYLDVLLSSKDIADFISKYHNVERITECDKNLLQQIEANRKSIEENKALLETSKEQIEILKSNKESTAETLKQSESVKQEHIDELNDEKEALNRKREELDAEEERIVQEIAAYNKAHSAEIESVNFDGKLIRPVKTGEITCLMYYSWGQYHGAIDYGVSSGTPVYAAGDGYVVSAGWETSGFGYCVRINHGGELLTIYGHGNGVFYVSKGQKVEQGQLIMQSGNTGWSTGPHLHFEVREANSNGGFPTSNKVDPRKYMITY